MLLGLCNGLLAYDIGRFIIKLSQPTGRLGTAQSLYFASYQVEIEVMLGYVKCGFGCTFDSSDDSAGID
jgi:hypothetical protein